MIWLFATAGCLLIFILGMGVRQKQIQKLLTLLLAAALLFGYQWALNATRWYDYHQFLQSTSLDENNKQFDLAKAMFPKANVFKMPHLIDRAGSIAKVITNKHAIVRHHKGKKVVGCMNSAEHGGRPIGWIHVNAQGECFLCCNDYDMEIKFGDFKTQKLRDFWGDENHVQKIKQSYDTICTDCAAAKFN